MTVHRDRAVGALVGLAVGDAVGTTLEFVERDSRPPLTDMVGGGPFRLDPGQWTDDTSMALCLAESLAETDGMDLDDQMSRYWRWYKKGHLSSTGRCFDIGRQTVLALMAWRSGGPARRMDLDSQKSGNGSLMRLAPVAIRWADDPAEAGRMAAESSRTTHPSLECRECCWAWTRLMVLAINGADRDEVLREAEHRASDVESPAVAGVLRGARHRKDRRQISSSGYVVHSMEAALWALAETDNFRDGILLSANLGDDADTVAAIHGQLAGALYGVDCIPSEWVKRLHARDLIVELGERLVGFPGSA